MALLHSESLLPLANALRSGEIPLKSYVDKLEARFEELEPSLLAFVPEDGRFERLRDEASALEERFPSPMGRPPLFGIPVGVKDIFHVDGMATAAGSKLPVQELGGPEAEVVSNLRTAGALVMGKTVTTEFAYFAPGPTRNPHNRRHTPGGSSSGSAAAVGAGLCLISLGTQTIGSITRPASFCGVFGFKPSYDRTSRDGVIPLAPSLDHVGLFTTGVAGCELVASLLCRDWHLAVTESMPTLGIPKGPYLERASAEGLSHFEETCRILTEAGCVIKNVSAMADLEEIVARHYLILAAEAAQVHAEWYAEYGSDYDDRTAELIERGRKVSVGSLTMALRGRKKLRHEITALMDANEIDLWIMPAAPGAAPLGLDSTGDPIMNLPWTHAGVPTVNLPAGRNQAGLPLGLQIAGRWYEDERLLDWSADLEIAVGRYIRLV